MTLALTLAACKTAQRISPYSPLRPYSGPRLEGELAIEVKVFPQVMLRPSEGGITVYIHGSDSKLPQCSGWKLTYELGFSSEHLTCGPPPRIIHRLYRWHGWGEKRVVFQLYDLDKGEVVGMGYGGLQIGGTGGME